MLAAISSALQRRWWRPRLTLLTALLLPLAWLVAAEAARRRRAFLRSGEQRATLPVPVIVVGNVIVGGAGKTPTVISLVAVLRRWGLKPGIVSRGHGRASTTPRLLDSTCSEADPRVFGDEPVLMHRRTGAPVGVGRQRLATARELLTAHPEVDVLVADDGLQHHALPRSAEIVVFDGRGVGNARTLPAGPLREPLSLLWPPAGRRSGPARFILVNGRWPAPPARALPAPADRCWIAERGLGGAVELAAWRRGAPATPAALHALRGRTVLAAAGIGDPERFFAMLEARGLQIDRLPLPDHASFDPLPWPSTTRELIVTEKDAVKIAGRVPARLRVWVVTLDFALPEGLADALREALGAAAQPDSTTLPRTLP